MDEFSLFPEFSGTIKKDLMKQFQGVTCLMFPLMARDCHIGITEGRRQILQKEIWFSWM